MALKSSASPVITIAGSGPSSQEYGQPVTIATKKRPLPSDYVFCRFGFQADKHKVPLMLYYKRSQGRSYKDRKEIWYCDSEKWDKYWSQFIRMKSPPQRVKPSLGTCAVMAAVERWGCKEIGLIGFDNILDGNTEWEHDAIAEKRCIESLVNIIDLRTTA